MNLFKGVLRLSSGGNSAFSVSLRRNEGMSVDFEVSAVCEKSWQATFPDGADCPAGRPRFPRQSILLSAAQAGRRLAKRRLCEFRLSVFSEKKASEWAVLSRKTNVMCLRFGGREGTIGNPLIGIEMVFSPLPPNPVS